jgi:enoyl-CoA hydratase/long-chain 3-hydroxyacyl-CoA dehydrogenase
MAEGMALLVGGVEPPALDAALQAFGWPVGPVALMDEVGIDVSFHTFSTLKDALGDRMTGGPPEALTEMVARKMLGRKAGKGFYVYEPPGAKKAKKAADAPRALNPEAVELLARFRVPGAPAAALGAAAWQHRMLLRFVKECILCAEDDILAPGARDTNPRVAYATGDVGAIFGLGFPPFLGGPFRWCDIQGLQKVADDMQRLADTVGPHFAPPRLLLDLAKAGKTFHGA